MRQNRFTQSGVGQTTEHGDLHATHDLAGPYSKGGESENPVTAALDEAFEAGAGSHRCGAGIEPG
jgi:hypothetical protein